MFLKGIHTGKNVYDSFGKLSFIENRGNLMQNICVSVEQRESPHPFKL